ncbi:hypothetical protein ACN4EK_06320 [Pantanalinema rosaneae CENA516]|uniref:hypothetical protein n=1 Tax=Pantanalinema rosaneae TaxID=1620701 RepID=UPI003D6F4D67
MTVFVGYRQQLSSEELSKVLEDYKNHNSRYFLRWVHQVSGIVSELPEPLSPEGQMFDDKRELRWKKHSKGFELLLLSTTGADDRFTSIGTAWECQNRDAQIYPPTETRFPTGIDHRGVNVGQRYFLDAHTATVHFVALTVQAQQ